MLILKQVAAADRLLAAAMVWSSPDANATVATWGWFASGTILGVLAGALTLRQVAAAEGLPSAAMTSLPDADATVATC